MLRRVRIERLVVERADAVPAAARTRADIHVYMHVYTHVYTHVHAHV